MRVHGSTSLIPKESEKKSSLCKTAKPGQRKKNIKWVLGIIKVEDAIEKLTWEAQSRFSIPRAKSARSISTAPTNIRTPVFGNYIDSDKLAVWHLKSRNQVQELCILIKQRDI